MKSAAYIEGAKTANKAYGIRAASVVGRMPDGPPQLGASRLAKALENLDSPNNRPSKTMHKLERPTTWGNPASPESGGVSNWDSGLRYSGV